MRWKRVWAALSTSVKDGDELVDRRDGFRRFIIAGKRGSFAARGFGPLVDQLLVPGLEVRKALGVDDHRARVGGDHGDFR